MQRKIEPINAMGITFEEDEDKISTHETLAIKDNHNTAAGANTPPVTIRIESDMKNSIVISTTTLPALQDDARSITNTSGDLITQKENKQHESSHSDMARTGNLIVNQLMENYGYDASDEDIKKFKEHLLNLNCRPSIDGCSKIKSKSTNSIAITRSPNKSNSHGSIFDYSHSKYRIREKAQETPDASSDGKNQSKNLFPAFNFGRKYISKSFNNSSTAQGLDKCNGSCDKPCRKSTDLNFQA